MFLRHVPNRLAAIVLVALWLPLASHAEWYRGNTHTHTINSDGDSSAEVVSGWYRDHGYHFIVITDHEFLTDIAPLQEEFGAPEKFLVIRGQEVTQIVEDPNHPDGLRHAHVNAINVATVVMPIGRGPGKVERRVAPAGTLIADTYTRNIAAVLAAGGIAQVNHPNFRWSVNVNDIANVPDGTLFEVWNAHPLAHNLGGDEGGSHGASTEEIWDALLSGGKVLWGVGDDDSHNFRELNGLNESGPGRAWVMVRADRLTPDAITASLRRGDFYASTGITLEDIVVSADGVSISIKPESPIGKIAGKLGHADDTRYATRFIGKGGRTLAEFAGLQSCYKFQEGDQYVRAVISDSRGRRAWTQPVFLRTAEKLSKVPSALNCTRSATIHR